MEMTRRSHTFGALVALAALLSGAPSHGQAADPKREYLGATGTIGSDDSAIVRPFRRAAERSMLPHEIGHNLGRLHAPFCSATGIDASYPSPTGDINGTGFDGTTLVGGFCLRASGCPTVYTGPPTKDLMDSCIAPPWISAYTYKALFGAFAP